MHALDHWLGDRAAAGYGAYTWYGLQELSEGEGTRLLQRLRVDLHCLLEDTGLPEISLDHHFVDQSSILLETDRQDSAYLRE